MVTKYYGNCEIISVVLLRILYTSVEVFCFLPLAFALDTAAVYGFVAIV
jgi:hypothetical protein